jgi:hypothetical protein
MTESVADVPLDPLTRLYRACNPGESLTPDDPRYVDCDEVRGGSLVRLFERGLRRVDPLEREVKVFSGHRGVGKTSELLRLKAMLENPAGRGEQPFRVIFADVSRTLDLNDLDFPDLLVFTAAEVQRQLKEASIPGFSATSERLRNVWDEFITTVKSVSLSGVDIDVPFGSVALEIRNRPSSRGLLRAAIEQQSTDLLAAVNDLLELANVRLREAGCAGLVLIIDGLDKLVRRDLEDGGNTHDRLFIHRSEQLSSLKAHVIYTVPISLIYSKQFAQVEQTFGDRPVPVPMIRLRGDQRSEAKPDTAGMRKMKEMIEKRCQAAGVGMEGLFDSHDTCDHLCLMSGGHPRHLLMFLQAAIIRIESLPITRKSVDQAIRAYANSLLREMPDGFWEKLGKFATPQEDIPKDDDHQQMLLLLHVFEYMNGEPWWEVNPVIRTLHRFRV